jgi:uncharacterized membrane protein
VLDAGLLIAIFVSSYIGFALLAFSLTRHWRDVTGRTEPLPRRCRRFRSAGYPGLALGWALAILRDGPSLGSLLWFAVLTVAAAILALTLAWWPQRLRPLALTASRLAGPPLPYDYSPTRR